MLLVVEEALRKAEGMPVAEQQRRREDSSRELIFEAQKRHFSGFSTAVTY